MYTYIPKYNSMIRFTLKYNILINERKATLFKTGSHTYL